MEIHHQLLEETPNTTRLAVLSTGACATSSILRGCGSLCPLRCAGRAGPCGQASPEQGTLIQGLCSDWPGGAPASLGGAYIPTRPGGCQEGCGCGGAEGRQVGGAGRWAGPLAGSRLLPFLVLRWEGAGSAGPTCHHGSFQFFSNCGLPFTRKELLSRNHK